MGAIVEKIVLMGRGLMLRSKASDAGSVKVCEDVTGGSGGAREGGEREGACENKTVSLVRSTGETSELFCKVMSTSVSRNVEVGVTGMLSGVVMRAGTVLVDFCLLYFESILGVLLLKFF